LSGTYDSSQQYFQSVLGPDDGTGEPETPAKDEVCHWYNPGHLMPIVELSFFGNMPEAIYEEVEYLYQSIQKQTVKVLKDVRG